MQRKIEKESKINIQEELQINCASRACMTQFVPKICVSLTKIARKKKQNIP